MQRFIGVFILICLAVAGIRWWQRQHESKMLRVAFPLRVLRQDQQILEPHNTSTVYHYYLLENMALGLIRDSSQSPSGYAPGLARSWKRLKPTQWVFWLQDGLRWSNGAAISPEEITAHLNQLRKGNHRHITYLKKLRRAKTEGNKIILEFHEPTNDGLIHELSLADTLLLHPNNLKGDWKVVSGPYYVEKYNVGKNLFLRRNPYYPSGTEYPELVELINFTNESLKDVFYPSKIDLVRLPMPSFQETNKTAMARAPQIVRGYPTGIYFFAFNPKVALWRSVRVRQEFASIINDALKDLSFPGLDPEEQFVPKGFVGRLENAPHIEGLPAKHIAGRNLTINFHKSFQAAPFILEALQNRFAQENISLSFKFTRYSSEDDQTAHVFLENFIGNQKEALGSWKFLFSPDKGAMSQFFSKTKSLIEQATRAQDIETRQKIIQQIHRQALQEVYGVPMFIEPTIFLTSKRLDITNINRFDMRMRFYQMSWR